MPFLAVQMQSIMDPFTVPVVQTLWASLQPSTADTVLPVQKGPLCCSVRAFACPTDHVTRLCT